MKGIKLNNVTYKSADNIINAIEQRAKKQTRLYTVVFVVIVIVISCYVLDRLSYMEYDGYISHRDIKVRAIATTAIVDFYVKPGDIVNEGDTLYSQLMVEWLEDQVNPFTETLATSKINDSDLRIAKYESEIIEVNNTIRSLQTAIEGVERDVRSGVKTGDESLGLKLQLAECVERSKHLKRSIEAEYGLQSKYGNNVLNTKSLTGQGLSERMANLKKYGRALRYRVAYVDSKIIDIRASEGMLTLEHEEVLTFKPIGHPDMTNSHIEMIVEADRYGDIYDGMDVEVYAGGEYFCDATVSLLGVRMADAYANVESMLDRTTDLNGKIMVALNFKDGYELPEKFYIHNYPVKIRYKVWERWSSLKDWYNWFKE